MVYYIPQNQYRITIENTPILVIIGLILVGGRRPRLPQFRLNDLLALLYHNHYYINVNSDSRLLYGNTK